MIHVVTSANQHLYPAQLDQMFRMRHAFYIEGHGWSGLTSQDGRETDEFDDLGAVYLMSIDPWGELAASVRLNPTHGPTLLGKFSDYSDEPLPQADDVWDISRWIAQPKHRRSSHARWPDNHQRELIIGVLEFCQSRGLTRLTMLSELKLAERIATYGWPVRYLGAPREYEGGKGIAVAAEITVGPEVLTLTRQKTGVLASVLFEIQPEKNPGLENFRIAPSPALREVLDELGAKPVHRLIRAIADQLAEAGFEDQTEAIKLIAAFNRVLESVGVTFDHQAKQPAAFPLASNQADPMERQAFHGSERP